MRALPRRFHHLLLRLVLLVDSPVSLSQFGLEYDPSSRGRTGGQLGMGPRRGILRQC